MNIGEMPVCLVFPCGFCLEFTSSAEGEKDFLGQDTLSLGAVTVWTDRPGLQASNVITREDGDTCL